MQKICNLLIFSLITQIAYADPWYTGPLLAPTGKTIPRGHVNLETYGFFTENIGVFNRHWRIIHTSASESIQINPLLAYGLTDWMDMQFSLPYAINHHKGKTGEHIGDTSAQLGFQILEQKESRWKPNLRVTIQQIFPTGRYDDLNPTNEGTDGTGLGSYETAIGFNFQHMSLIAKTFPLRTRLCLTYLVASSTRVRGINNYGGTSTTNGSAHPGNLSSIDLAGELSLTQHWVAVMESYFVYRDGTSFNGFPGLNTDGSLAQIATSASTEISFAPAIEYNFSANYGIIGGVWFSAAGKDAPVFRSLVVAFNAYW